MLQNIDFLLKQLLYVVAEVTFRETDVVAVGQQTLGLQDTRVSSLALLQFRHYKPKHTLCHCT